MEHSRESVDMLGDEGFADIVHAIEYGTRFDVTLTEVAQRYAYVLPDDATLTLLANLGPLVEIGAGTGYWAHRLRARGVDIVALDQAPPDGDVANRYHAKTATWTEVVQGDHTALAGYADRALFLCWPPLFSALGDCLSFYTGTTIAVIGDGGHRTARIRTLDQTFTKVASCPVHALEPDAGVRPMLSIWTRHAVPTRAVI